MVDRSAQRLARDAARPMRAIGQEIVDHDRDRAGRNRCRFHRDARRCRGRRGRSRSSETPCGKEADGTHRSSPGIAEAASAFVVAGGEKRRSWRAQDGHRSAAVNPASSTETAARPPASPDSSSSQPVVWQKCAKSLDRTGIGREHFEHAARRHILQRAPRLQYRQRAFEPGRVQCSVRRHRSIAMTLPKAAPALSMTWPIMPNHPIYPRRDRRDRAADPPAYPPHAGDRGRRRRFRARRGCRSRSSSNSCSTPARSSRAAPLPTC